MASTITAPSTTTPHLLSNDFKAQANQTALKGRGAHNVVADFNSYKDPGDGSLPAPSYVGKPETYERPAETRAMVVHDIRGEEDKYTLDKTGFQIYRHVSKETAFEDEAEIKRNYYPEVEDILKSVTGASKIFIFDHTIRRQSSDKRVTDPANALRGPIQRVHIDQSYKAGPERVQHHFPADAERLLKGRYQIINVWRPIKTIRKDPLGVADATSVPEDDLLPVQLIYPDRVGETFTVRPNLRHRWFYLREQTPREVMLIKCFDSKLDGRARRAPHSAFVDQGAEAESPRESIEVRALVFHPDDVE
ncbi:hypothetical protein ABVK25_011121 [Lepraria finkii]|uniref:Uncharacterized protein n=1 Tax=Lepraria finkii TaxID=1340010 RepID=A0ABR4ARC3_9LECA